MIYIYRKQLEEAEIIVVNKTDLVTPNQLSALVAALKAEFPNAQVLPVWARDGSGIDEWISLTEQNDPKITGAMDVDYEVYAEGEALFGWLNCMVRFEAENPMDGNAALLDIATRVQTSLREQSMEIAHLKLTFTPDEGNDIAVANLVRNDGEPELSHMLQDTIEGGQLILNLPCRSRSRSAAGSGHRDAQGYREAERIWIGDRTFGIVPARQAGADASDGVGLIGGSK